MTWHSSRFKWEWILNANLKRMQIDEYGNELNINLYESNKTKPQI